MKDLLIACAQIETSNLIIEIRSFYIFCIKNQEISSTLLGIFISLIYQEINVSKDAKFYFSDVDGLYLLIHHVNIMLIFVQIFLIYKHIYKSPISRFSMSRSLIIFRNILLYNVSNQYVCVPSILIAVYVWTKNVSLGKRYQSH